MDSGLADQCVTIGLAFIAVLLRRLRAPRGSVLTWYLLAFLGGGFAIGGAATVRRLSFVLGPCTARVVRTLLLVAGHKNEAAVSHFATYETEMTAVHTHICVHEAVQPGGMASRWHGHGMPEAHAHG